MGKSIHRNIIENQTYRCSGWMTSNIRWLSKIIEKIIWTQLHSNQSLFKIRIEWEISMRIVSNQSKFSQIAFVLDTNEHIGEPLEFSVLIFRATKWDVREWWWAVLVVIRSGENRTGEKQKEKIKTKRRATSLKYKIVLPFGSDYTTNIRPSQRQRCTQRLS